MTIEDTLSSIDTSLKALVQFAQTYGAASAELGKPEAPAPKTRGKKGEAAAPAPKLLAGDPEGTRYFVIDKHNTVARVTPGELVPSIEGTVEVDSETYTAKKEEFAKKSLTAGAQAAPTTPAATANATTATASTASSGADAVSFKTVVDQLILLSKDTRPGKGREGLTAFLKKHRVDRVPALEALNKTAELLAEVNALLAPDAAPSEVDPFA